MGWITALVDFPCKLSVYKEYLDFIFDTYGATAFSNTAVKRNLILNCKELLNNVHAGEDWIAKRYIMNLGLKTITIRERLGFHDKDSFKNAPKSYLRWGESYRLMLSVKEALKMGYLSFLKYHVIDWLKFTRNKNKISIPLLFFLLFLGLCGFIGILKGNNG